VAQPCSATYGVLLYRGHDRGLSRSCQLTQLLMTLQSMARNISTHLGSAQLDMAQACFLPSTSDGAPVIGALPSCKGAYVATGNVSPKRRKACKATSYATLQATCSKHSSR